MAYKGKLKYADGLPLGVIGFVNFTELTRMQIMIPAGNRTQYEATVYDKDNNLIASREFNQYSDLRSHLAETMHIGLKYTDAVLAQAIDYNARFQAACIYNSKNQSRIVNQYRTEHLIYSVIHHPAQQRVHVDNDKDHIEPEFYRSVCQKSAPLFESAPLFDDITDSLFDAVVVIRNHIEKSIIKAFMPEVKL